MPSSSAYTIVERLRHGSRTTVYRAIRNADGRPVVLEVLAPRSCPKDLERLKREYDLGASLATPAVVEALALDTHEGMPALVLEDFGGRPLDRLIGAPMPPGRFLPLAVRIAGAVADLHQQGVIHKDLKPDHILVDPATGEVKITDLGLASRLPREQRLPQPPALIEGSLPYLAPEQTGRTNRAIDERTDLYSLGVTFHQMLTAKLPFEARDAAEWVHCHVARAPPSPADVVPGVPEPIARIVLKLLSKMPEDRYQSARGLRVDCERCLEQWTRCGRIEPFELGERDIIGRLQIPQKLCGREVEIGLLFGAFGRVAATGRPELLLVSGYAGIGKTTLVHELHRQVVRERGFFIEGKFDQRERDIPYSTLVQALQELVREVLAESEERLAAFRQRLLAALGSSGKLVATLIPVVELLIGPQPAVAELPPAEAQRRLRRVLRRFVGVFAQEEHPLVLFVDDLQWVDPASLALLHELVTHPAMRHLLVIGAYRDNEVSASHPLVSAVAEARSAGARVSEIVLGPIPRGPFAAFVGDALHCTRDEAAPLADLVHDRTAGNPFFAIQFLLSLHEERLIELDESAGAFRWDIEKVRAKSFTDNVVDFMVEKLGRLPEDAREALKQLACLGSAADIATLAMVHGRSAEALHADLRPAVQAGLVLRVEDTYRFLHDRVQEAAYSRIPERERAAAHLRIGRLLSSRAAPGELQSKIFEIANQLDRGAELIESREERERVAELDLAAGKRARASAAYASALEYFAAGAALLAEDTWDRRYDLAFALELRRAECEHLTGDHEAAEERLAMLWRRARDIPDMAAVTCAREALYTTPDRSDLAVEACLDYLRRVGIEWTPHPTDEEIQSEYNRMWQQLGGRPIEDLVGSPPVTDPICRATMDVLTCVQSPALFTDENLHWLVVGRMANLSLEHGVTDGSCIAYVRLGMVLGPRFGSWQAGYRFAKVGLDLLEKHGLLRFEARVYLDFGLIHPWTKPMRGALGLLRRSFEAARESGDMLYASYACNCSITLLLALGDPLGEVQQKAEDALDLVRKVKFGLIVDILTAQLGLVRALRGLSPAFPSWSDAAFDDERHERHLEADPGLAIAACWYWIRKLQARYFAGDHAAAVLAGERAQRLLWTSPSFFEVAEHHFFGALARAAHHDAAPAAERPLHLQAVVAHHAQLEVWAGNCPESFGSRAALVAAEIARIEGRHLDAEHLYEQAIRSARENGFVHVEAIAHETAARYYRSRGFELFADTLLREARACYARWGADGKVAQIDRQHPRLLEPSPFVPTATVTVRPEQLDLISVTKASQTISGEIVLDRLVRTLLEIVLEQGGAERAHLLLYQDEGLSIRAEAALEERGPVTTLLGPELADLPRRIPMSLVHYVQRTKERVILSDAAADAGKFAGDDYLARTRPRSVLCMPILRQAEVVGLLYLENNLLPGVFTPERLTALELLATQAAISLHNALLLAGEQAARAKAEEAVSARNEFLTIASHELNTPVTSLMLAVQAMRRATPPGRSPEPWRLEKLLDVTERQAARLTKLVGDLLDVSRLEEGSSPLDLSDVDLGELVREVVLRFEPDLSRARCPISIEGGPGIVGRWDRSRVDRVVTNLLSNAIKFGAGEPIEISFGSEPGVASKPAVAWLRVRDHGIGVDPAERARIFGRFERAVSVRHYGGLGLGLYLCRRIVEDHGGSIRCDGQPGAGSTFTVELPCSPPRLRSPEMPPLPRV